MKRFFYVFSAVLTLAACFLISGIFSETSVTITENAAADYGSCEEHIYLEDYTEVTPATCTASGVKWRKCARCGYIDRVDTPRDPDNHTMVSSYWTYDPEPNCTDGGVMFHICFGCNKRADVTELPADPEAHVKKGDYVTVTPATCTETGEKAYKCAVCGDYFDFQEIEADPSNHVTSDESRWEVTVLPECAKAGSMICYCDNCGEIALTKSIPATGNHTPGHELIVDAEPTCVSDGSESYHCTVCGASVDARIIPADPDAHSFSEKFTTDKEATCSYEGAMSRHCDYCDAVTDVTVIPVDEKNHVYGDEWIITREPDCSVYGLKHKVCGLCGAESNSTIIPKAEHTYGDYEILQYSADELSAQVKYTCEVCGYEKIDIVVFGPNDNNADIGSGDKKPEMTLVPVADAVLLVDNENMYVYNVAKNKTITEFLSNFKNGNVFIVYDTDSRIADENGYIATGYRVNYEDIDGIVTNYRVSVTGDVNSDGKISSADARRILRAAAGLESLKNEFFIAADVNGDGKINAADARKTLRVAAALEHFEETLPPIPDYNF